MQPHEERAGPQGRRRGGRRAMVFGVDHEDQAGTNGAILKSHATIQYLHQEQHRCLLEEVVISYLATARDRSFFMFMLLLATILTPLLTPRNRAGSATWKGGWPNQSAKQPISWPADWRSR